jgi:plastocyanin
MTTLGVATCTSLVVVAALGLSACSGTPGKNAPVQLGDAATISVADDYYEPAHAVVSAGATVTWQWDGNANHNVVGDGFESPVQALGSFTHTFDEPGTYEYACALHGNMDAIVEVVP